MEPTTKWKRGAQTHICVNRGVTNAPQEEKLRGRRTMKCAFDLSPDKLAKFLDSQEAQLSHFRAKGPSPRIWRPSVSRSKALKDDFNAKCGVTGAILSDTVQPLSYFNKLSTKEVKSCQQQ